MSTRFYWVTSNNSWKNVLIMSSVGFNRLTVISTQQRTELLFSVSPLWCKYWPPFQIRAYRAYLVHHLHMLIKALADWVIAHQNRHEVDFIQKQELHVQSKQETSISTHVQNSQQQQDQKSIHAQCIKTLTHAYFALLAVAIAVVIFWK